MFYIYSDCDTEWQDCIEEDERYLVEKLRFYDKNGLSDRCTQEQEKCSASEYPGCNLSTGVQEGSYGYNSFLGQQRYPRKVGLCGKCGCTNECVQHCRVYRRNSDGQLIKRRCERITDRKKTFLPAVPTVIPNEQDDPVTGSNK